MREETLEMLACIRCKSKHLGLKAENRQGQVVKEGLIFCKQCHKEYTISHGIPIMLPERLCNTDELRYRERETSWVSEANAQDTYRQYHFEAARTRRIQDIWERFWSFEPVRVLDIGIQWGIP